MPNSIEHASTHTPKANGVRSDATYAVCSLVAAIASGALAVLIAKCWLGDAGYFALIAASLLSVDGLVLGALGLDGAGHRALAVAGVVFSVVGLLGSIVAGIVYLLFTSNRPTGVRA